MWNFDASSFALAGLIAGAGPVLIHLLNRRRFRVVEWAAMDFLKNALARNRRILHIRDLLILALRIAAVVLFGLTLAKPYYTGTWGSALGWGLASLVALACLFGGGLTGALSEKSPRRNVAWGVGLLGLVLALPLLWMLVRSLGSDGGMASQRAPVHAILIVDNSRSMGTEELTGTLLERAKAKAGEYLETLPLDSRFSILPLCGGAGQFSLDAYRTPADARRALDRITVTDLVGSPSRGLELAKQAAQAVTDLPGKRLLILTDLQQTNWSDAGLKSAVEGWEEVQIARITSESAANVWISAFQLEDGLAGVDAPSRLLARVQAAGSAVPVSVQVTLTIDDSEVATQAVEISPGQTKELEFTHQFDLMVESGRVEFSTCRLSAQCDTVSADRLPRDNTRILVVPVVASLPVVFVDQFGGEENLNQKKIGETYALRHLLAPRTSRDRAQKQLIQIEHVRPEQLTIELLATARLVVMAGVEDPGDSVPLLRDYVRQGGQLVLFAGGNFNPAAWTERAWLDGQGILPCPLAAEPFGVTPEEDVSKLKPFQLAFESLVSDYFLVAQEDPEALRSLLESTVFFKAVKANLNEAVLSGLRDADLRKANADQEFLAEYQRFQSHSHAQTQSGARATSTNGTVPGKLDQLEWDRKYRELEPNWWAWRSPLPLAERSRTPAELALRQQPRVMARFAGNDLPFLVERPLGAGQVLFFTSGISSHWNLLSSSASMFMFHRICSGLIEETLPRRNFNAGQRITLPWERKLDQRFSLIRPNQIREPLPWEALGADVFGVEIRQTAEAGSYRLLSENAAAQALANSPGTTTTQGTSTGTSGPREEIPLAVIGSELESDLTLINPEELAARLGPQVRIFQPNEAIPLSGGARRGHDLWKWLAFLVLTALVLEMVVLAGPHWKRETDR